MPPSSQDEADELAEHVEALDRRAENMRQWRDLDITQSLLREALAHERFAMKELLDCAAITADPSVGRYFERWKSWSERVALLAGPRRTP